MDEPEMITVRRDRLTALLAKSTEVGTLLADAEVNHGGLIGTKTLRAANELRLELSRWK